MQQESKGGDSARGVPPGGGTGADGEAKDVLEDSILPSSTKTASVEPSSFPVPEGMDPNTSYLLKLKLLGNPKKVRRDMRCYLAEKVVDSDLINYKDLVESIVEEFRPGYMEVAHLRYYDTTLKERALGGSGFRFVVNLKERACSCRQWQVSGIPCKHALAFITSLNNAPIENYVDWYYSIDKFRAAYDQLIPAMPDKNQWPTSTHGFFMHPPLLKATAGRPKTERHKGCTEKNKKGQHKCPICLDYGHHWHNCKKGNRDDIAAMMAVRTTKEEGKDYKSCAIFHCAHR